MHYSVQEQYNSNFSDGEPTFVISSNTLTVVVEGVPKVRTRVTPLRESRYKLLSWTVIHNTTSRHQGDHVEEGEQL